MDFSLSFQTIAGLIALAFLYNLYKTTTKSKSNAVPEPPGAWPIIGHLHQLGRHEPLCRTFSAMADKYGPAFIVRLGMRPTLIISSWELAKDCFTTNDKIFMGRPSVEVGNHMSYNNAMFGLATPGPYWRDIRKLTIQELLSSRSLDSLKNVRAMEVDLMMKELYGLWETNGKIPVKVDMRDKFADVTFNAIAMMVIGKRYFGSLGVSDNEDARKFRVAMQNWFHLFGAFVPSDYFPFLKWWDVKGYKKEMKMVFKDLDSPLTKWLAEKRSVKAKDDKTFINVLIPFVDNSQFPCHDADTVIKATLCTALLGGYDAVWIAITWTLSVLLNHKHVIKKAQDELDNYVGKDRNVDESDINNLVYLQAILKETLRLYPPAPMGAPHQASEDCYVGGYHVPAGTRLFTNVWKMHRDPRVWSDPDEFQPERFMTKHADVDPKGTHFEFLPFGSGRRMCPGVSMAFQILHLILARLLHGFDLRTPFDAPVDMSEKVGITVAKATPLEVLLSPRLPLELYK
ncbi:cytochrome P450 CYP82D47-like [Magnolia sinica]|uniref:cytochrome P450 CYP82D47-like n=1 Tax=Magnolia sinica TaxID=86752 RepID=UPI002658736E|nr:cytochrome P450 CYP82D47-like [Magnolia sinica]